MATTAGSIVIDLLMKTGSFETDSKRAEQAAKKLGKEVASAGKLIGGAMTTVVGVAALAAKSAIDYADSLAKMSQRTSLSVETLNGLSYAADLSNTSLEKLGVSTGKLAKFIGDAEAGNKQAMDTLKRLGITARDPEEALYQLADAFRSMQDPNQRATELNKLLGESWQELAPLLSGGGAAMRALVERGKELNPVTAEMTRQSAAFKASLTTLEASAKGAGTALANDLLPWLNKTLTQMTEGIRIAGSFSDALKFGIHINPFNSPGENLKQIRDEIKKYEAMRADLMNGAVSVHAKDGTGRVFFNTIELDQEIGELKKRLEYVKVLRAQALGLPTKGEMAAEAARQRAEVDAALRGPIASANQTKTGKVTDPLASVLSETYLARVQEYVKLVDLLNARFADGARNPEQYAQALEALYQKSFGPEIAEAARRQQNQLEMTAFEVDSLNESTNDAQKSYLAWADAIKETNQALVDSVEPTAALLRELARLKRLSDLPGINQDAITAAIFNTQDQLDKALGGIKDKTAEVAGFSVEVWKSAAQNMQSSLADFLFDPFQDGLDGMLLGFVNMLKRMAAEALAANIMSSILGWGSSQGGVIGSIASAMVSGIPARANGGSVSAGSLYRINERNVEYFRPNTDGMVYPVAPSISQQLSSRQESQNIRIVNVPSEKELPNYVNSSAFERVILNIYHRNSSSMRKIYG